MSKGDWNRPVKKETFDSNWDKIDWGQKVDKEQIQPKVERAPKPVIDPNTGEVTGYV